MKKLFLTLLFATAAVASFAQGVKFHHGSWEELLADAKKQKKPFYVDFWATWCGPCIMMNKTTFQDPQVAAYSNSNFIAAKFDVDKEGQSLAQKYSIRAMPTVVFFDAEGKELFRQVGFVQGPEFLELLKKANNKGGGGSGKGGKETGSNAKPGKPTETPATFDDYLKLKTPVIEQVEGRAFAAVAEFKQQAIDLGKARNDFDYEDLKKKAAAKLKPEELWQLDVLFYQAAKKTDEMKNAAEAAFQKDLLTVDQMHWLAWQFVGQNDIPSEPMRWINKAIRTQSDVSLVDLKAALLFKDGKQQEALMEAKRALKDTKGEDKKAEPAKTLLKVIEQNQ